jgi:hypothetical protein
MTKIPDGEAWTDDDLARLRELIDEGATLLRANTALRRNGPLTEKSLKAGLSIKCARVVQASLRTSDTIEPGRKSSRAAIPSASHTERPCSVSNLSRDVCEQRSRMRWWMRPKQLIVGQTLWLCGDC